MAQVKQRNPELERRCRELVTAQARSGLSVRAFCASRRISEPSFYGWRRELAERDAHRRAATPTFVPVQVLPSAAIEVVLSAGLVVRVPAGADGDLAVRLVAALAAKAGAGPC